MPKLKCKVGDLAIVTRCLLPERIGLLVKVIEGRHDGRHDWLAEIQGPGMYGRDVTTGKLMNCKFGLFRDWHLTPIHGIPMDDDIDTQEPIQHGDTDFRRFLINLQSLTEKVGA